MKELQVICFVSVLSAVVAGAAGFGVERQRLVPSTNGVHLSVSAITYTTSIQTTATSGQIIDAGEGSAEHLVNAVAKPVVSIEYR